MGRAVDLALLRFSDKTRKKKHFIRDKLSFCINSITLRLKVLASSSCLDLTLVER